MKTYDEFLTWAAKHHYQMWYDFADDADGVAWGHLQHSVINTASASMDIHTLTFIRHFRSDLMNCMEVLSREKLEQSKIGTKNNHG